nr:unnamed protein product [Callosobruchus analis]
MTSVYIIWTFTMRKWLWLLFLITSISATTYASENASRLSVGTVLYSASDVIKQCWSQDEIAILSSRLVLEDLLPEIKSLQIDCNEYVDDLVEYFKLIVETVRTCTRGRKRHLTLIALTDLIGGYLNYAVLPLARRAYYAGVIDYFSMEKLIELFEEVKWFLRTNGQGWANPMDDVSDVVIEPINVNTEYIKNSSQSCCKRLIYFVHGQAQACPTPIASSPEVIMPLPYFDAKVRPSSIALPFRRYALRNIESRKASYAVLKFYILATRCLHELNASPKSVKRFQNELYSWIERQVIPKLDDNKFYSAFGAILRIEETLKSNGGTLIETTTRCEEAEEEIKTNEEHHSKKTSLVIAIMLVIIFLWFILGTLFICCRMRRQAKDKSAGEDSKKDKKKDRRSVKCFTSGESSSGKWSCFSKSTTRTEKSNARTPSGYSSTGTSVKTDKTEDERKKICKKFRLFCSSSASSESERHVKKIPVEKKRCCLPPGMNVPPGYYNTGNPAVIDAKNSMKVLPSIAELSENSSQVRKEVTVVPCPQYVKTTSGSYSSTISKTNERDGERDFGAQISVSTLQAAYR